MKAAPRDTMQFLSSRGGERARKRCMEVAVDAFPIAKPFHCGKDMLDRKDLCRKQSTFFDLRNVFCNHTFLKNLYLLSFYVSKSLTHACLCTMCLPRDHGSQKWASESPWGWRYRLSHHVSAGNWSQVFWKNSQYSNFYSLALFNFTFVLLAGIGIWSCCSFERTVSLWQVHLILCELNLRLCAEPENITMATQRHGMSSRARMWLPHNELSSVRKLPLPLKSWCHRKQ